MTLSNTMMRQMWSHRMAAMIGNRHAAAGLGLGGPPSREHRETQIVARAHIATPRAQSAPRTAPAASSEAALYEKMWGKPNGSLDAAPDPGHAFAPATDAALDAGEAALYAKMWGSEVAR